MITMRRVLSCLYHINPQFRCLLIPKPSFLFQRKEVAGSSSTCPKKEDKETAPPSLLAFLHVSSLQCKLKVGRWPIFQCQDMHLCQDMHPCLICSCTSASTQAPRCAFAPGECRYWCTLIRARTLRRSRHFTCDYYLCTQRCSCAIIIAHHMLSFWCNPQLRCPHFFLLRYQPVLSVGKSIKSPHSKMECC